jgi:hypothetical protein
VELVAYPCRPTRFDFGSEVSLTNRDAVSESKKHEGRDSGDIQSLAKDGEEIAIEPHPASEERVAVTV